MSCAAQLEAGPRRPRRYYYKYNTLVGLISNVDLKFSARGEGRNARVRHQKRSAVYQARHMCWGSPSPAPWGMGSGGCLPAPHLVGGGLGKGATRAREFVIFHPCMRRPVIITF